MRQRRWPELLKDYDFDLSYHPGNAGVLSRKSLHMSILMVREFELIEQFRNMILVCEEIPNSVKLGLPKTAKGSDLIWVIVDRLTKSSYFLSMRINYLLDKLVELYINEIVKLHGIPWSIVYDKALRLTSKFWKILQKAQGSELKLSSSYHPQMDDHTERTIRSFEDLLRSCMLEQGGAWDSHLSLIEFTYNISFHASIGMTLVIPVTGVGRALKFCKLTSNFVCPYYILQGIGEVAYRIALPPSFVNLHDVFHVSQLRKYIPDPSHVVQEDDVQVRDNLTVKALRVQIGDREMKHTCGEDQLVTV
ncbi:uncharacterized protein LOC131649094 [Vicia villosa]|uniref:uncharacterized protein LOC131649094 n=1 Tax=Vicia villosa TaxID=3911 RepID=UPI00273C0B8E|nr:uncharacterized protein LOC131649094 [Vicia villosa]